MGRKTENKQSAIMMAMRPTHNTTPKEKLARAVVRYYRRLHITTVGRMTELLEQTQALPPEEAKQKLSAALENLAFTAKKVPDVLIDELLKDCLVERDAFVRAIHLLASTYGCILEKDENLYPGPWSIEGVRDLKICLGMAVKAEAETPQPEAEPPVPQEPVPEPTVPLGDETVWGEPLQEIEVAATDEAVEAALTDDLDDEALRDYR